MLKKLTLRNFKAFREAEIDFGPMTLIVGPNGSGKTSILQAIRLASLLASEGREAFRKHGFPVDQFWRRGSDSGSLDERLWIVCNALLPRKASVPEFVSNWFSISSWPKAQPGGLQPIYSLVGEGEWKLPTPAELSAGLSTTSKPNKFAGFLSPSLLLQHSAHRLAAPSVHAEPFSMSEFGDGLPTVMSVLSGSLSEFARLHEVGRAILPSLVEFRPIPEMLENGLGGHRLEVDTTSGKGIRAEQVSEGTLLVMGLLAQVFHSKPKIVLVENLGHGLHPAAFGKFVNQLRNLQRLIPGLQIVGTTHSPYLIDCFSVEEVVVTSLGSDGVANCRSLSEHPDLARWKDVMEAGEFWSTVGEDWIASRSKEHSAA